MSNCTKEFVQFDMQYLFAGLLTPESYKIKKKSLAKNDCLTSNIHSDILTLIQNKKAMTRSSKY